MGLLADTFRIVSKSGPHDGYVMYSGHRTAFNAKR